MTFLTGVGGGNKSSLVKRKMAGLEVIRVVRHWNTAWRLARERASRPCKQPMNPRDEPIPFIVERGGRAAEKEPLKVRAGAWPLSSVGGEEPQQVSILGPGCAARSWTGSKAHCCPDLATTLYGTICGIGPTYTVSEVVLSAHSGIHSADVD